MPQHRHLHVVRSQVTGATILAKTPHDSAEQVGHGLERVVGECATPGLLWVGRNVTLTQVEVGQLRDALDHWLTHGVLPLDISTASPPEARDDG